MNKNQKYIETSIADYFLITNTLTNKHHVFTRYGAIMTSSKYGNNKNMSIVECQEDGTKL